MAKIETIYTESAKCQAQYHGHTPFVTTRPIAFDSFKETP